MWGNMKIAFNSFWIYEFESNPDEKTITITETNLEKNTYAMNLSFEEARSLHSFLTSILNKGDI
jgi:hypothetical protein